MKRIIALALAVCMLFALLCACGKKDKKQKDEGNSSSTLSSALTPTPAPATPAPVQTAKAAKVSADGGLNIRSEPSTDGEILGVAEDGSLLPLLTEKADDGWYQIEFEGKTAYISAEFAKPQDVTLAEYNRLRSGSGDTLSSAPASSGEVSSTASGSNGSQDGKNTSSTSKTTTSRASSNEDGE